MTYDEIATKYYEIIKRNCRKIIEEGDYLPYYKERELLTKEITSSNNDQENRDNFVFYSILQLIFDDGRIIGQREAGLYLE